ncbi:hypothetical protein PAXRUDRAFT_832804 [Paxillus rubicundulus Ve08.2h10]|uniref:Uncharacterized protein n=1 Tax=Paxillus rubicundulus Ve08.2h10 TaxID=930991 RepID=A0A0D0CFM9_9AGAM|nr:hypothetical protein PAXRUDRAFT_832804 [Paxillus rubicundulus Ve08.2h10]
MGLGFWVKTCRVFRPEARPEPEDQGELQGWVGTKQVSQGRHLRCQVLCNGQIQTFSRKSNVLSGRWDICPGLREGVEGGCEKMKD